MFVLVFIRTLGAYLARRDPLQRDVMLVFSAMAVLFVTALVRKFVPSAPVLFDTLASALVLAQPLLTLRLVGRLRRVPRWLMACAFVGWAVSSALLVPYGARLPPPAVLLVVLVFVVTELVASGYFVAEGMRRSGAPRARLYSAGLGTMLFATAIAVAGSAAGHPGAANAVRLWSQTIALLSAAGYALAFVPPGWLRGWWSATAALSVGRELLDAPVTEAPEATWGRYADLVAQVCGADGVLVLMSDGIRARAVATTTAHTVECSAAALDRLTGRRQPVPVRDLDGELRCIAVDAPIRFVTTV